MEKVDFGWRNLRDEDLAEFQQWILATTEERWRTGDLKYESSTYGFQDYVPPEVHLTQEIYDALLYIWVILRKLQRERDLIGTPIVVHVPRDMKAGDRLEMSISEGQATIIVDTKEEEPPFVKRTKTSFPIYMGVEP